MNMRWRFNSCRDQRENISLLAGGALPEGEQASVREHLAQCAECRRYYEEIAKLTGEFQQWARTERPVQADAAFRARWMRSIAAADSPAQASLATRISRWSEWLWPSPVAWGALAAVWVCLLSLQWRGPGQPAIGHQHQVAGDSRKRATTVTFAQRQSELASLLEALTPPPPATKPEPPRPRSQRPADS